MSTDFDEQRVLSEASHDLANRIHRSYYVLELLSDAIESDQQKAGGLVSRLRESIEEIEAIVRTTLTYLRPIELRLLSVPMDDLVASLRQHVGLRSVVIAGDASLGRSQVNVDPARMSEALGVLCRAAIAGSDEQAPLVVELVDGDPIGLRLLRPGVAADAATDIGIALTAKIARLHGGALDVEHGDSPSLTLRLPVVPQEN